MPTFPQPMPRSEAFAEDLLEADHGLPAWAGSTRIEALLGLLPLCIALIGFAFALL
ncbi:MAG TPA: hypothetical protein VJN44_07440 [Roseateles sp.]|nr:hypothetical protein [Roseateles sp.]